MSAAVPKDPEAPEAPEDPADPNATAVASIGRIFDLFDLSDAKIRPHFVLTGPSGSGKSHTIATLADAMNLPAFEINAAGLTKEGTAGNSLSKALTPLLQTRGLPTICFVDEFDKLFISGNSNGQLAHETTNGVQNEFLKVLEGQASVYTEFGKYTTVPTDNILFVFAGAFNGEPRISADRLRELGVKTEFLGRVGLTYDLQKISLEQLRTILDNSQLLADYLTILPGSDKDEICQIIMATVEEQYKKNIIGVRLLNKLIHQYFIEGTLSP